MQNMNESLTVKGFCNTLKQIRSCYESVYVSGVFNMNDT